MWYNYRNNSANWDSAANDCYENYLGSTLPVLKTQAQMQLAFNHQNYMGKITLQFMFIIKVLSSFFNENRRFLM